jgi:O-antigen ligase
MYQQRYKKNLFRGLRRNSRIISILTLITTIGIALVMNGSSSDPYQQIAFLLLAFPLLITLAIRLTNSVLEKLWITSVTIIIGLLAWLLLQSTPLPFAWFDHPVWQSLTAVGISVHPTLSVAPATTRASIPSLIFPILVFAAMLLLCQERREAVFAWKALASLGLLLAGLSVFLENFLPQVRFFSSFEVGRDSFNGIFVNRNIMAAFLALVAFATSGWLMLPRIKERSEWHHWYELAYVGWTRIILIIMLFLLLILLIMTRSRAGVSLALLCLTLSFAVAIYSSSNTRSRKRMFSFRVPPRAMQLVLVFVIGGGFFVFFGDPVVSRMELGLSDGRLCAWHAAWQMFLERPILGLGFGTFEEAFPQYRDPECLGQSGAWTRAHNSHLELLAGMGLIGLLGGCCLLLIIIFILFRGIRTRRTLRPIPVFAFGALLFMLLHSIVDFPLQIPGLALYFAAMMGVSCATASLTRHSKRRSLS